MSRLRCVNEECSRFGVEEIVPKTRFKWNESSKKFEMVDVPKCKECGRELELIPNDTVPVIHFNKFDSMTSNEKREMIHKRSVDHFNRADHGDLARYKQKVIDDNKIKTK